MQYVQYGQREKTRTVPKAINKLIDSLTFAGYAHKPQLQTVVHRHGGLSVHEYMRHGSRGQKRCSKKAGCNCQALGGGVCILGKETLSFMWRTIVSTINL